MSAKSPIQVDSDSDDDNTPLMKLKSKQRKTGKAPAAAGAAGGIARKPAASAKGGAAVSAAGGASAPPRAKGAPRKCPKAPKAGPGARGKCAVSAPSSKGKELGSLVAEFKLLDAQEKKKTLDAAKNIPCNICFKRYSDGLQFGMDATTHKSHDDFIRTNDFMRVIPNGKGFMWECTTCEIPSFYPENNKILQALQTLGLSV
jgi:hypothetical protein